jgi:hypothetical protein
VGYDGVKGLPQRTQYTTKAQLEPDKEHGEEKEMIISDIWRTQH